MLSSINPKLMVNGYEAVDRTTIQITPGGTIWISCCDGETDIVMTAEELHVVARELVEVLERTKKAKTLPL